jgi:hypothetical protein
MKLFFEILACWFALNVAFFVWRLWASGYIADLCAEKGWQFPSCRRLRS